MTIVSERQLEDQFRIAVEESPCGLFDKDPAHRFADTN